MGEEIAFAPSVFIAECVKLIRFFVVNPEANWLIDRYSDFKRVNVTRDEVSTNMIHLFIRKTNDFGDKEAEELVNKELNEDKTENTDVKKVKIMPKTRNKEGRKYVLIGLFPMIYKYVTSFMNLTNFRNKDEISESYNIMVN